MSHSSRLPGLLLSIVGLAYWTAALSTKPVVSLVASSMIHPGLLLGLIISGQALLPLFLAVPLGSLADRIGQRSMLMAGAVIMAVAGVLYARAGTPLLLFVAQTFSGLGQVGVWLSAQSMITTWDDSPEVRQRQVGQFTFFMALGEFLAPLVGTQLLHRFGSESVFWTYTAFGLLILTCAWLYPKRVPARAASAPEEKQGFFKVAVQLIKAPGLQATLICTFLMLYMQDLYSSLMPIYMTHVGRTVSEIGVVLAAGSFATMCMRVATAPALKRWGLRITLLGAVGCSILGVALVPAMHSAIGLGLLSVISGIGLGVNQPLTLLLIAQTTPAEHRGVGMGLRLTANRLAQLSDPLMFSVLASTVAGYGGAFVYSTAFLVSLGAVLVVRLNRAFPRQERSVNR